LAEHHLDLFANVNASAWLFESHDSCLFVDQEEL